MEQFLPEIWRQQLNRPLNAITIAFFQYAPFFRQFLSAEKPARQSAEGQTTQQEQMMDNMKLLMESINLKLDNMKLLIESSNSKLENQQQQMDKIKLLMESTNSKVENLTQVVDCVRKEQLSLKEPVEMRPAKVYSREPEPAKATESKHSRKLYTNWPTFRNINGISSYADCVMHALFALRNFRKICLKPNRHNIIALRILCQRYMAKERPLSTVFLWSVVGLDQVSKTRQKYWKTGIESVLKYAASTKLFSASEYFRCQRRHGVKNGSAAGDVEYLLVNPRINASFESQLCQCATCGSPKEEGTGQSPEQLAIHVARYNFLETEFDNRPISGFNDHAVNICKSKYRVVSAIQHFGENSRSDHSIAWVYNLEDECWLKMDDKDVRHPILRAEFPSGLENVCLLFLEKYPSWATFSPNLDCSFHGNSAIHALFALKNFRKICKQSTTADSLPSLQTLHEQYQKKNQLLNTEYLIKAVNGPLFDGHQSTKDFIEKLLKLLKADEFLGIYRRFRCKKCQREWTDDKSIAGSLTVDPKIHTSFDEQLCYWKAVNSFRCSSCSTSIVECSINTTRTHNQIMVHVSRYNDSGSNFDNHPIHVNGHSIKIDATEYRIVSAIQHFGASLNNGHSIAWVCTKEYGWLKFDGNNAETPVKCSAFPSGLENVYMLFLEPVVNWATFDNSEHSSYANSVMHAIFALKNFHGADLSGIASLAELYEQYQQKTRGLSTETLRQALGPPFLAGQQDALKFMKILLAQLELSHLFQLHHRFFCKKCNHEWNNEDDIATDLVIDRRNEKSFRRQLCEWMDKRGEICPKCDSPTVQYQRNIRHAPDQMLVTITHYNIDDQDSVNSYISGFDDCSVKIGKTKYRAVSAIEHEGPDVRSGHYTAWVYSEVDGWLKFDDVGNPIESAEFPNKLENIYLLFLEKDNNSSSAISAKTDVPPENKDQSVG